MTHTLPDEIDPARWLEAQTDAGTLDPYAYDEGDPDYLLEKLREREWREQQ